MMPVSNKLALGIYKSYLDKEATKPKRTHMGASTLGDKCSRAIYYDFRWYDPGFKDGRILRLFETGQEEEPRVIRNLRDQGFVIRETDDNGNQIQVRDSSGHIGGSVDGIIDYVPLGYNEVGVEKCVLEVKTHSEKNFRKFDKAGVKISFPKHYTQMQVYMGMMKIPHALYLAVNKNNDELYHEFVTYDSIEHERAYNVAKEVLLSDSLPVKLRENPSWFECKMCKFHSICHMGDAPPKSCRTCAFSVPIKDGKWSCSIHEVELDKAMQQAGCDRYKIRP